MYWKDIIENNATYILLGLAGLTLILFIITIVLMVKQHKLNAKYKKFMQGTSGEKLEDALLSRFTDIDMLKNDSKSIHIELEKINENLLTTIQKVGVVKYDAFHEMGGKLSFVLALLNKNNDGIIINSVHSSREGCYTYLKEIIKGESFLELSSEEKTALEQAIKYNSYME